VFYKIIRQLAEVSCLNSLHEFYLNLVSWSSTLPLYGPVFNPLQTVFSWWGILPWKEFIAGQFQEFTGSRLHKTFQALPKALHSTTFVAGKSPFQFQLSFSNGPYCISQKAFVGYFRFFLFSALQTVSFWTTTDTLQVLKPLIVYFYFYFWDSRDYHLTKFLL
jgi:hypothetical protein